MSNTSRDDVREYIVMIDYEEEIEIPPVSNLRPSDSQKNKKSGSGILVRPTDNSSYCYVITAAHTFPSNIDSIKNENIILQYEYKIKTPTTLKTHHFFHIKDYDTLILILNLDENEKLKETNNYLEVLDSDLQKTEKTEYIFAGYPSRLREIHSTSNNDETFKSEIGTHRCVYDSKNNPRKHLIEFKTENSLDTYSNKAEDNIKGASGGGVFKKVGEICYLVAMETEVRPSDYIVCVDLKKIIPTINNKIREWCNNKNLEDIDKEFINLRTQDIFPDFGIDINSIDFSTVRKEIENNEKFQKDENIDFSYKNIIYELKAKKSNEEKIRYIDSHDRNFKKFNSDLENLLKLRAATYLYRGILFRQIKPESRKGAINIRKAVSYDPTYMPYLIEARNKNTLSDKKLEKYLYDILKEDNTKKDKHSKLKILEELSCLQEGQLNKNINNIDIKNNLSITYSDIISIYSSSLKDNNKKAIFLKKLADLYESMKKDKEDIHSLNEEILELNGIDEKIKERSFKDIVKLYKNQNSYDDKLENFLSKKINNTSMSKYLNAFSCEILANILEEKGDNKLALQKYNKSLSLYEKLAKDNDKFDRYSKCYILCLNKIASLKDKMKKDELIRIDEDFSEAEKYLNKNIDDKNSETYKELMSKISKSNLEGITEYEKEQRHEFKGFLVKQYEIFEKQLISQRESFKDYLSKEYSSSLNDFREEQSQSFKGVIDEQKNELRENTKKQKEILEDVVTLQKKKFEETTKNQKEAFNQTIENTTKANKQQKKEFAITANNQKKAFSETIEEQKKEFEVTTSKQKEAFSETQKKIAQVNEKQKREFQTTANNQKEIFDQTSEQQKQKFEITANKQKEMNTKNKRFYSLKMASLTAILLWSLIIITIVLVDYFKLLDLGIL